MSEQTPPPDLPDAPAAPVLRVMSPATLTPEEIAALAAVLSSAGGGDTPPPAPARSDWTGRARWTWRSSGLPPHGARGRR